MIKIGSYTLTARVIQAPLAGVSDLAFRLIAREHGAQLCFFEMVDANSLIHEHTSRSHAILRTTGKDAPVAAQILGEDPAIMLRSARKLLDIVKPRFLDINAACPARKVVKKKAGAYLLLQPERLFASIRALASALPVPVTVKLRIGYEAPDIKAIAAIARGCESNGASAIFVHGRTQKQGYAGEIDYASIRAIKESVKVPVIASGNIFNGPLAKKMFDMTACDGILVARGGMGRPWIFGEIEAYLRDGTVLPAVDIRTKQRVLLKHLGYIEEYKDASPLGKVGYMRKFVMWYLRSIPNATSIREQACVMKTYEDMIKLIESVETTEMVAA